MRNIKKDFALLSALTLLLCGCAANSSESITTVDTTTAIETTMESETETETETETEKESEAEETPAESEKTTTEEETTYNEEETTEEFTTAFVEEGETNDRGIVDGQDTGVVETVSSVSDASALTSNLPYLIKVNRYANTVTVYSKDAEGKYTVPVKAMICSCGRAGKDTPVGTFKLQERYVWRRLFGNVYGYYSTRIQGSILFHSVPYVKASPNTLENWEYDKLGGPASLGCIRLRVQDSKWIFDNCATGTYVIIYDSADPGPLGKPEAQKIGSAYGVYAGWDPTDPTPGNPWATCSSIVFTANNKQYTYVKGTEVDILRDVGSYTAYGQPADIAVSGAVNKDIVGEYPIIYSVTDNLGRSYAIQRVFKIIEKPAEQTTTTTVSTTAEESTIVSTDENTTEADTTTVAVEETTIIDVTETPEETAQTTPQEETAVTTEEATETESIALTETEIISSEDITDVIEEN